MQFALSDANRWALPCFPADVQNERALSSGERAALPLPLKVFLTQIRPKIFR
jgi:hypothetical protein